MMFVSLAQQGPGISGGFYGSVTEMSFAVWAILVGWVPIVFLLFLVLPPRRAVIWAFMGAWLFLPMAEIKFATGIPAYGKITATAWGILAAVLFFDLRTIAAFRFRWWDLPMAVWCLCPIASSLSADLGLYDGLAAAFGQVSLWGISYFIGRIYFRTPDAMRELAVAVFVGGLLYVPLCLLEMRLAPQLHIWVYGFHQHMFAQAYRGGAWRPTVFMQHGLMVGMWMCMTSLVGLALWVNGTTRRLAGLQISLLFAVLATTAILCRSVGAIALALLGALLILIVRYTKLQLVLLVLLAIAPLWIATRITGVVSGRSGSSVINTLAGAERARSFEQRLEQEDTIVKVAAKKPIFGAGAWGIGADQLWLLVYRNQGAVGLIAMLLVFSAPMYLVATRCRPGHLALPDAGPLLAFAVISGLYLLDNLLNAMVNPVYMLMAGGVSGATFLFERRTWEPERTRPQSTMMRHVHRLT